MALVERAATYGSSVIRSARAVRFSTTWLADPPRFLVPSNYVTAHVHPIRWGASLPEY